MLINSEKSIIKKGYKEFTGKNLWNFYKKGDYSSRIILYFDISTSNYIFEFPLNNSVYNYKCLSCHNQKIMMMEEDGQQYLTRKSIRRRKRTKNKM